MKGIDKVDIEHFFDTGVDKGGPGLPPMAGKKEFFVKIEGLSSFT